MALPEYRAREIIQNVGIVSGQGTGAGLKQLGIGLGEVGARIGIEEERERKVAEAAYIADVEVRNRERIAEISAQNRADPEKFRNLAKGHIEGVLSSVPEKLRPRIAPSLNAQAVGEYGQSLDRAAEREKRLQLDALQSNINSDTTQLQALADAGIGGSPAAVLLREKIKEQGNALVLGGFKSQDAVNNALSDLDDETYGRTVLSHNRRTFERQGFGAAWKELNEMFESDPTLKNMKSRSKLLDVGQGYLREQTAAFSRADEMSERSLRRQENDTAKTAWETLDKAKREGNMVGFTEWFNKNRRHLPLDEAKTMSKALQKPDPDSDDLDAAIEIDNYLLERMDARSIIRERYMQGKLKTATAMGYFEKNRTQLARQKPESPYEMAVTDLEDAFDPGMFKMDVDSKGRRRTAIQRFQLEFTEESDRKKQAGELPMNQKEIFELKDNVKQRFLLQEWESVSRLFETPRFIVGNRNEMNIDATESATAKAFNEGRITSAEAERQAMLMADWRRAIGRRVTEKKKK